MSKRRRNITGAEKVERFFDKMPAAAARDLAAAINKSGEEVVARAKALAPDDTGRMRETIDHEIKVDRRRGVAARIVAGTDKATAIAARASEFGRRPGGKGMEGHPGHAAQPFMFPAYWSVKKRVMGRIKRAITKAAKAAVARG